MKTLTLLSSLLIALVQCTEATSSSSTCTSPNLPMKTITFVYDQSRQVMATKGSMAGLMVNAAPDGLLWNMCRGIFAAAGVRSNNITLTAGDLETRNTNRGRLCKINGAPKCTKNNIQNDESTFIDDSMPTSAKAAIRDGEDLTCTEFPFARTVDATLPGFNTWMCVSRSDAGWQGGSMSGYFCDDANGCDEDKIHDWCNFAVEIIGWDCVTQGPTQPIPRSLVEGPLNLVGDNLYHNFDPEMPGYNLLSMPLGDLGAGDFDIDLNVSSGNLSTSVVSYDGDVIPSEHIANGSISFSLNETTYDLALIGTTSDTGIQVSYSAKQLRGTSRGSPTVAQHSALSARGILALSVILGSIFAFF